MITWGEAVDFVKETFPGCEVCHVHLIPIKPTEKHCYLCCPPGLCYTCGKNFLTFSPRNQCDDCLWPRGFPILSFKWWANFLCRCA